MDKEYYIVELAKLLVIINQDTTEPTIHRSYVREKIERILNGVGIGIHPSLEGMVEQYIKNFDN